MGLIARTSGTLEVLAPQPFSLSLVPKARSIRQNDSVQTLSYRVLFDRTGGFLGPVYLELVGFVGRGIFNVNPIPVGASEALLTFDTAGMPTGLFAFDVVGYETQADIPA